MKIGQARRRAKQMFAERIAAGDTASQAGAYVKKNLQLEAGADWIMIVKLILPLIEALIKAFQGK